MDNTDVFKMWVSNGLGQLFILVSLPENFPCDDDDPDFLTYMEKFDFGVCVSVLSITI